MIHSVSVEEFFSAHGIMWACTGNYGIDRAVARAFCAQHQKRRNTWGFNALNGQYPTWGILVR